MKNPTDSPSAFPVLLKALGSPNRMRVTFDKQVDVKSLVSCQNQWETSSDSFCLQKLLCSLDNKSWFCLILPLLTAPKLSFWLMAIVGHVTCVCLEVFMGSWICSFATVSCLSGPFLILLSLLPLSLWGQKSPFWLCFWGNQASPKGKI